MDLEPASQRFDAPPGPAGSVGGGFASGGGATEVVASGGAARSSPPAPLRFEEVYERHAAFVFRNLRRLGVPERSLDDAVQDVFVVVHRRLPEFEGRSAITTWLFAIVLGVSRNHRRTQRRRAPEAPGGDEPDDLVGAAAERPDRRAERAQAVRVLCALLDELDDDKREAFVLSQLEGMTAPAISEALGVNVNTVYARIRAATKAFEQAVARFRAREDAQVESAPAGDANGEPTRGGRS